MCLKAYFPPFYLHPFPFGFLSLTTQRVLPRSRGWRAQDAHPGPCAGQHSERCCLAVPGPHPLWMEQAARFRVTSAWEHSCSRERLPAGTRGTVSMFRAVLW